MISLEASAWIFFAIIIALLIAVILLGAGQR